MSSSLAGFGGTDLRPPVQLSSSSIGRRTARERVGVRGRGLGGTRFRDHVRGTTPARDERNRAGRDHRSSSPPALCPTHTDKLHHAAGTTKKLVTNSWAHRAIRSHAVPARRHPGAPAARSSTTRSRRESELGHGHELCDDGHLRSRAQPYRRPSSRPRSLVRESALDRQR